MSWLVRAEHIYLLYRSHITSRRRWRNLFIFALALSLYLFSQPPSRMLRALVDYAGDSDEENGGPDTSQTNDITDSKPIKRKASLPDQPETPPKKAKALPKLDDTLFIPAPVDDPSKHQGRKRTIPYVEGQFIAHVCVPVKLDGDLLALLREVVRSAQTTSPAWHSLLEPALGTAAQQGVDQRPSRYYSHLSLSRPVPMRAHQRDDFRREVRKAAQKCDQFPASFVRLTTLTNDDKSRTFLCVEIGAGHKEFQALSQSLTSHLASLRQLPYYAQPRFHISIAWILTPTSTPTTSDNKQGSSTDAVEAKEGSYHQGLDAFLAGVTLMVERLQSEFSERLLALGRFNVHNIEVKIGKDIHKWPLANPS